MPKTISIVIATLARPSLKKMLDSIKPQLAEGDEVIVVGDAPEHKAKPVVEEFGPPFRYIGYNPPVDRGWVEVAQKRDIGIREAKGDYINYQDDDDVMAPDALQHIRRAIAGHPGKLLLFQMRLPTGQVYPYFDSYTVTGGACFVFPNDQNIIGWFKPAYGHDDQEFMVSTIHNAKKMYGRTATTLPKDEDVLVYVKNIITYYSGRSEGRCPA